MKDLVAVDVGNTRTSCGLFRGGLLRETWHHPTCEPQAVLRLLESRADSLPLALCSVVPAASAVLAGHWRSRGRELFEVRIEGQQIISGIYSTMGADRLADAVAAWKLYGAGGPALAIDLGTATTLTAVSAAGEFRGGLITLGLGRTMAALHQEAAQLPAVELTEEADWQRMLAFDTEAAITAGTLQAHVSIVEQWVKLGRKALGGQAVCVATGGWSSLLARQTKAVDYIDPDLTLKGIYLIAGRAGVPADPA